LRVCRSRPCTICRRWFCPDPRVGARQRACSATCTAKLRKKTQAAWRARHPEYAIASRIAKKAEDPRGLPPRVPPPLTRLPWDLAKDEFGVQRAEFLGALGRLLVWAAKDEIRRQALGSA
jgi:hypothetical protein